MLKIYVFGQGKVGRALGRGLRATDIHVTMRSFRAGWPKRSPRADLVVLAIRDGDLEAVAHEIADRGGVTAAVHCAGAYSPSILQPLQDVGCAVGQLHPLISLAEGSSLQGAYAHIAGDEPAVRLAREVARGAGMTPWTATALDTTLYHACAALLANGGAALAALASEGLVNAGAPSEDAPRMLGVLLESVGRNLQIQGLPGALTGPVRRGNVAVVSAHMAALRERAPQVLPLYRALVEAQIPLARELGEADASALDAVAARLSADDDL